MRAITPVGVERTTEVLALFAGEWWTNNRTIDDVTALLIGSTATVGITSVDSTASQAPLVGFARVLSDRHYLALILDVIVTETHRGAGLGDELMRTVLDLECVRGVTSVELVCQPDVIDFYRRHGFSTEVGGSTLMRRSTDSRLAGDHSNEQEAI